MNWVVEVPQEAGDRPTQPPAVGSIVRTADRDALTAALEAAPPALRPSPGQLRHAGQLARVVSVRFDEVRRPIYRLDGVPGEWEPAWLRSPGP